ncbi:MAG: hypothetical protein EBE86_010440 [Hormoscilla sp. GUM202]|nr:hypothetical protein [Hormoscilla sp. GUM202]
MTSGYQAHQWSAILVAADAIASGYYFPRVTRDANGLIDNNARCQI